MELEIFLRWSISRQAQYTWKHGNHLARKDSFRFNHDLYLLDQFFVEIVYNLELCQVESVDGFVQTSRLYPYVEHIDLQTLYS